MKMALSMAIQLIYFPIRGRAQAIRYICLDNGIEYNDVYVRNYSATEYKPQMPVIKDGRVQVTQSCAILKYLAKRAGLTEPKDPQETGKDDLIKDAKAKMKNIETPMKDWGNEYILDTISYADYNLFDMLDILCVLSPGFMDDFPTLKAYYDRMADRPAIKKHRESEAFKAYPVNGNGKQ